MLVNDNVVYSPPGRPDAVYLGGSFDYGNYGFRNNGRAFIRSTDAGVTFTDMTWDATTKPTPPGTCCQPNSIAPNGQHPDSHAIVELPGNNGAFFGGDGGITRQWELLQYIVTMRSSRAERHQSCNLRAVALGSSNAAFYKLQRWWSSNTAISKHLD